MVTTTTTELPELGSAYDGERASASDYSQTDTTRGGTGKRGSADGQAATTNTSTTDGKHYQCNVCGESFRRHEHLIRHSRRHTLEKPFKCLTCGKEFARRDILSRHAIVHVPQAERAALPQKATKRASKRVQQACNNCAKGKCRCDGATPCSTCQARNLDCEYTIPTPQKRRRADSSASQAAANVLLQVANSAGTSPKHDWALLDPVLHYSAVAPHQSSAGGVGATTYASYQPTLSDLPSYSAFASTGYGSGAASRPGSTYVSRAASPSHDFDAAFENAGPAPSLFSFLFNDPESQKNLPGLTSILPNLFATPTGFHDFTGGGAGGGHHEYSNYRDSVMGSHQTIDPAAILSSVLTRPTSPTVSASGLASVHALAQLGHGARVPALTEQDRTHLQDYVQAALPSADVLNFLVQLFFEHFQPNFPMLHQPNYKPQESHCIVTLAVLTVGAKYLPDERSANELFRSLDQTTQKLLRVEGESTFCLQAQLLIDMAELHSAQSQAQMDAVEERHSNLIKRARQRNLFSENYDEAPASDVDTEGRWQILRRAEERRRLSWSIFTYDFTCALFFGTKPLIELDEVRVSLPCDESLWNPATAKAWAAVFAPDRIPLRTRNLWGIGRVEEKPEAARDYGMWCRSILALVEARRVYDFRTVVPQRLATESQAQAAIRNNAESTAKDVRKMSAKALRTLEAAAAHDAYEKPAQKAERAAVLATAVLSSAIDFAILRKFALGDERSCLCWAKLHAHDAEVRQALHCASRLVGHLRQSGERGMLNGLMTLFAVLTVAFAARYLDVWRDEATIDLAAGPQAAIDAWLASGYERPIVAEFGILSVKTAPAVLERGIELLGQTCLWGRDRMQICLDSMAKRYTPA